MIVNEQNFPLLRGAFAAIERDHGAHLIGTVYPGAPIDLDNFAVPEAWAPLCAPAEAALSRLKAESADDFDAFVSGAQSEQDAIVARHGDLADAHRLINDWFCGWQPEDRPK